AIVPVVDFAPSLILCVAVTMLQPAFELILITRDDVEIVIRQLTRLLLHFALKLFPVSLNTIPIHVNCSSVRAPSQEQTKRTVPRSFHPFNRLIEPLGIAAVVLFGRRHPCR